MRRKCDKNFILKLQSKYSKIFILIDFILRIIHRSQNNSQVRINWRKIIFKLFLLAGNLPRGEHEWMAGQRLASAYLIIAQRKNGPWKCKIKAAPCFPGAFSAPSRLLYLCCSFIPLPPRSRQSQRTSAISRRNTRRDRWGRGKKEGRKGEGKKTYWKRKGLTFYN